jgi:hypothetical protein
LLIISASFLTQLIYIFFSSAESLVKYSFVDDAFYYLNIAHHWMDGSGASFDGIHRTNGFQPLWQLCLLPFGLLDDKILAIRCSCLLGALFFQSTSFYIYILARDISGKSTAMMAVGLWSLNARFMFTYSINGMEFSLYALVVSAAIYHACSTYVRLTTKSVHQAAVFTAGLLGGLCILTRLDGILLPLLIMLWFIFGLRGKLSTSRWLNTLLIYSASAILVILPYFIWNKINFCHWIQVSGTLKRFYTMNMIVSDLDGYGSFQHLVHLVREFCYMSAKYCLRFVTGYYYYLLRFLGAGQLFAAVLGSSVAVYLAFKAWKIFTDIEFRGKSGLVILTIFSLAHFGSFMVLLTPYVNYGTWYYGPMFVTLTLISSIIIQGETECRNNRKWMFLVTLAFLNIGTFHFHEDVKINIKGAGECVDYIREHLHGEAVGAWNAGYLGYFLDDHVVTNMDGLVSDYDRAESIMNGAPVIDYLRENNIGYVCDYLENPEWIHVNFYGMEPGEYDVVFTSGFYEPKYVEPRKYFILKLR